MATLDVAALKRVLNAKLQQDSRICSQVGIGTSEAAVKAADDLVTAFESAASSSDPSFSADFGWTHDKPIVSGTTATIRVYPSNNTRPSLYERGYPEGAYNLVMLFDEGYSAEHQVYGEWHGNKIRSRTYFGGTNFIDSAIASFEKSHPTCTVTFDRG